MDNNSNNQSTPVTSLPPVEPQPQIPSQNPPTPPTAPIEKPVAPPIEVTPEPEPVVQPTPNLETSPILQGEMPEGQRGLDSPEPQKTAEPTLSDFGIVQKPTQTSNFFKVIFIFALIIFILVGTVLAFVYFKNQKTTQSSSLETITTPSPSGTCLLNDKTYQVGESFVASDGCNTCTCSSQNNISCTDNQCLSTKTSTKSAITTTPTLIPTSTIKVSTSSSEKL